MVAESAQPCEQTHVWSRLTSRKRERSKLIGGCIVQLALAMTALESAKVF